MKNILIVVAVLLLIAGGTYYFISSGDDATYEKPTPEVTPTTPTTPAVEEEITPATSTPVKEVTRGPESIIGQSVDGTDIKAYHFGEGDKEVLFIGGIHGGYSWNTSLLAYELIDWLKKTPDIVPKDVTVTIIPVLNPDGLKLVTGKDGRFTATDVVASETTRINGRFNANEVDLNRNFACEWKATGTWQNRSVSGGSKAFSEPESLAIKSYVSQNEPVAIVTWYSAAGGVYASNCNNGVSSRTEALTNLFAKAAGYTAHEEFDYYEITGDMVNWFASQDIPAISVLLTDHKNTELTKNKAGVKAVLDYVTK
jgi:Zinc carboxypeptidase